MKTSPAHIQPLLESDPTLAPWAAKLEQRWRDARQLEKRLTGGIISLADFAAGHEYFGLNFNDNQWVLREWAPHAEAIILVGDMTAWQPLSAFAFRRDPADAGSGVWELRLPTTAMTHGDHYHLLIRWPGGEGPRIPAYARRVVQDPKTGIFSAQVWKPPRAYQWQFAEFSCKPEAPLIYEAHVGMAQEVGRVGTYLEFCTNVIPRIVAAGYNTIQLMAIPEHPYYASFGYHVANFFAASSRFGTPEELKALIDCAHGQGLAVIIDIVHSHTVANEVEGLGRLDGTTHQYFHAGKRGHHPAWGSRCFDYGKPQVLHFLLSNCRFWIDAYRVDGFRFDGITSMLYRHHGLGTAFTTYAQYFDQQVDEDALAYLTLANRLIHSLRADAITIAEDVSGMPGLAFPAHGGGVGFDYRFAMGVPDLWSQITSSVADEHWPLGHIRYELTHRRTDEKTISYVESHDQAIVGDKTMIMRLMESDIYDHMHITSTTDRVDRALALHKMIRLITLFTAGNGYLNFMGNEFGHPEWIDFPRPGNDWSYHYARRQWSLADNPDLKFQFLAMFDRDMIQLARTRRLLETSPLELVFEHEADMVVIFQRGEWLAAFNFNPIRSYSDYPIPLLPGCYRMVLDSDARLYGGHGRLQGGQVHHSRIEQPVSCAVPTLRLYLPTRTAIVLKCDLVVSRDDETVVAPS